MASHSNDYSEVLVSDVTYRNLFDLAEDGMWIIYNHKFQIANKASASMLGYESVDSLTEIHPSELSPPTQFDGVSSYDKAEEMMRIALSQGYHRFEWLHKKRDGTVFPVEVTLTAIPYNGEKALFTVWRDITHLKEAEEKLRLLAHQDPLTGLPNRLAFTEQLAQLTREQVFQRGLAILFLDLDGFKYVNDSFGHLAGDELLKQVAARLRGVTRSSDRTYRLGGDEFTLIMENPEHSNHVCGVAEKLHRVISQPFIIEDKEVLVTTSIGISLFPKDGASSIELLKNADAAMYRAKAQGRNRFEFFSEELAERAKERLELEQQLRHAIAEQQLELHYQPQFELATGKVIGAEALVRWRHPERGMIAPDRFIGIAEQTGLILPLGSWVLHEACRQFRHWQQRYPQLRHVSVNIASQQIESDRFVATIEEALAKNGLSPSALELEITETSIMQQTEKAAADLQRLKALGVNLAIDDFGTGYSSLCYLKKLPVQKIKIDRSFVDELAPGSHDATITRAIIALARSLQLTTVAEGVETLEQLNFLLAERCDQAQGYFYTRPLAVDDFDQWMLQQCDGIPLRYAAK